MRVYSQRLPVILFTLAYLGVAAPFAYSAQNTEFLFYIIVVLLLGGCVLLCDYRIQFPRTVLWGLSAWGLLHMLGGLIHVPASWPTEGDSSVLYSLWVIPPHALKYDQIIHAYGFGFATWACFDVLRTILPSVRPTMGVLTFCVLASMGLGALNEMVEFTAVLLFPKTNVGGYINTGWDLMYNALGSIGAAALVRLMTKI